MEDSGCCCNGPCPPRPAGHRKGCPPSWAAASGDGAHARLGTATAAGDAMDDLGSSSSSLDLKTPPWSSSSHGPAAGEGAHGWSEAGDAREAAVRGHAVGGERGRPGAGGQRRAAAPAVASDCGGGGGAREPRGGRRRMRRR